jgi:hypothetical protein
MASVRARSGHEFAALENQTTGLGRVVDGEIKVDESPASLGCARAIVKYAVIEDRDHLKGIAANFAKISTAFRSSDKVEMVVTDDVYKSLSDHRSAPNEVGHLSLC